MAQRTIPLTRLMVGMYLIGVDRSWLQTPFLRHKFRIKDQSEIDALRERHGHRHHCGSANAIILSVCPGRRIDGQTIRGNRAGLDDLLSTS